MHKTINIMPFILSKCRNFFGLPYLKPASRMKACEKNLPIFHIMTQIKHLNAVFSLWSIHLSWSTACKLMGVQEILITFYTWMKFDHLTGSIFKSYILHSRLKAFLVDSSFYQIFKLRSWEAIVLSFHVQY